MFRIKWVSEVHPSGVFRFVHSYHGMLIYPRYHTYIALAVDSVSSLARSHVLSTLFGEGSAHLTGILYNEVAGFHASQEKSIKVNDGTVLLELNASHP